MNIIRCDNEKELADKFENDLLICYSLAPNIEDSSLMCSFNMKKDMEVFFGKSKNFINGKVKKVNFFAFNFNDKIIICTCESSIGTSWYWNSTTETGTRYGNPMLLSSDKDVKDFWPDFCSELKTITNQSHNLLINHKPKIR